MTNVIKEIKTLTVTEPRENKHTGKLSSYLLENGEPFYLSTPYLKNPFGLKKYGDGTNENNTHSLNISAVSQKEEEKELVDKFFRSCNTIQEALIVFGLNYSKKIFGKEYKAGTHEAVVEALCTQIIKKSDDKDGNPYPDRITAKIKPDYDNPTRPNLKVYTTSKENINTEDFTFNDLVELIQPGSFVKLILQPHLWFINGKFGVSFKVIQLKIAPNKKKQKLTSYAFSDDEENEDDMNEGTAENDDEEEQDDDDNEVEEINTA